MVDIVSRLNVQKLLVKRVGLLVDRCHFCFRKVYDATVVNSDYCILLVVLQAGAHLTKRAKLVKEDYIEQVKVDLMKAVREICYLNDIVDISVGKPYCGMGKSGLIDIRIKCGLGTKLFELMDECYLNGGEDFSDIVAYINSKDAVIDTHKAAISRELLDMYREKQHNITVKDAYKDTYEALYDKSSCSTNIGWKRIYNRLIEYFIRRGYKKNGIDAYEAHHIIPRCMNGKDDLDNLVVVTIEEHTLLHCLLYLSHPDHNGLLTACAKRLNENLPDWELMECFNNRDLVTSRAITALQCALESGSIPEVEGLRSKLARA